MQGEISPCIFQIVASLPTKDCYYWHYTHTGTDHSRIIQAYLRSEAEMDYIYRVVIYLAQEM
jgi:hypothetical protein